MNVLAAPVADRALVLAARSAPMRLAVRELVTLAGGNLVLVELARRRCRADLFASPTDVRLVVAVGLLDLARERLSAGRAHPAGIADRPPGGWRP